MVDQVCWKLADMSTTLVPSKRPHDQNLTEPNVKAKLLKTTGADSLNQSTKSSSGSLIFRVLCPSRLDGIICKDSAIISQIELETGAKIKVEDSISGCDERIVAIASSDRETELNSEQSKNGDEGETEIKVVEESDDNKKNGGVDEDKKTIPVEGPDVVQETPLLQKALLLVFEKIVDTEPEPDGGNEGNKKTPACVFRLLVLSNQVGCLLGKGGSVIKQMSAESGAQIRILPRDKLPICASASDELVQISGDFDAVRKGLQLVSQQIIDNPPRDNDSFPSNSAGPSSNSVGHPFPRTESYPPPHHSSARGTAYASGHRDSHETVIPGRMKPSSGMLTFRLLCHDDKVGGVIGKGGSIIKTLQQETGCEIKVTEGVSDSQDRIILVSGPAHPDHRISPAQDAILRVQTRIARAVSDGKEKTLMARLLISSNQIGCLLGKGGSVMAEMRKTSGAYIRILPKDQLPKCASENEEVIQINGDCERVQEALLQITTRLRHHFFRDVFPSVNRPPYLEPVTPFPPFLGRREHSPPFRSFHNFDGMGGPTPHAGFHPHDDHSPFMHNIHRLGRPGHISERRPPWGPQGIIESGPPMGMPEFAGPIQRRFSGFGGASHPAVITSTTVEVIVPRSLVPIIYGEDGACLKQIRQISDAKITITEPKAGATETVIIISGTPEQTHAAQSLIQAFVISENESA